MGCQLGIISLKYIWSSRNFVLNKHFASPVENPYQTNLSRKIFIWNQTHSFGHFHRNTLKFSMSNRWICTVQADKADHQQHPSHRDSNAGYVWVCIIGEYGINAIVVTWVPGVNHHPISFCRHHRHFQIKFWLFAFKFLALVWVLLQTERSG